MDKKDPKRGDNQVALSNLSICYTWNNIKSCTDVINLKYLDQNGVLILNCLMNLTPYQTFRTNLNPPSRSMKHWLIDHQLKYINRTQNRVTIKIEFGNYNEFLTPETIKLGSTEQKINKDKNGKNVPPLKIIEVVLVHCNIVNNYTSMNQEFRLRLFQTSDWASYYFPNKSYLLRNIMFKVFTHWSMFYWSKLQTSRDRRYDRGI